jgi:hypothetical protein
MVNRKKRLEKGMQSLDAEIKLHEEKREKAGKESNLDLEEYYNKEIEGLEKTKERKEKQLRKFK